MHGFEVTVPDGYEVTSLCGFERVFTEGYEVDGVELVGVERDGFEAGGAKSMDSKYYATS